ALAASSRWPASPPCMVRIRGRYIPFFFFSSRRRHTSFSRDWSSDVCSSDLGFPSRGRGDCGHHFGDLVGGEGLEPPASSLSGKRSDRTELPASDPAGGRSDLPPEDRYIEPGRNRLDVFRSGVGFPN